jgi:hypothetical protein
MPEEFRIKISCPRWTRRVSQKKPIQGIFETYFPRYLPITMACFVDRMGLSNVREEPRVGT